MPSVGGTLRQLRKQRTYGQYILAGPDTRLNWLGDSFHMPNPIYQLFPQAYSPGDLVMALGILVVGFLATRLPSKRSDQQTGI
jgi:hypothetical protein